MRSVFFVVFLAGCAGSQPSAPAPHGATTEAPADGTGAFRFAISDDAARAVCPIDRMAELGAALPALVAGCNVVPPWTKFVPFIRCPAQGCPQPCAKTTNTFGSGTETGITRYRYDAQGRLVEEIAKGADGNVIYTIRWDFSSAKRWHQYHSTFGDYDYELDAKGRLIAMESASLRHLYDRDAAGQLVAERIEEKGGKKTIVFQFLFDDKGRLRSFERTEPSAFVEFVYGFEASGLLESAMLRSTEWRLHWAGSRPIGARQGALLAGEPERDDIKITYDDQGRPMSITNNAGGFDRFEYDCKS